MTRDEAIAELLCMAEELTERRKTMLTAQKIEWEAEDLAEIKAALAEPDAPRCEDCNAELVNHACPDEPDYCLVCDLRDDLTAARKASRCQHQAADASLDCTEPAVLCETHGGHDGCAAAIADEHERGYLRARDEIARALRAKAATALTTDPVVGMRDLAEWISDGSIREWLPKESG